MVKSEFSLGETCRHAWLLLRRRGSPTIGAVAADAAVELDGQYRVLREGAGLVDRSERGKLRRLAAPTPPTSSRASSPTTSRRSRPARAATPPCSTARATCRRDMRVLRLGPDRALDRPRAEATAEAVVRHLSLYRVGRRRSRSPTTAQDRAILSVIGPGAASGHRGGGPRPEHAHRELEIDGHAVPRRRHRSRARPDLRRRRAPGGRRRPSSTPARRGRASRRRRSSASSRDAPASGAR